jgi:hypothetical protein
LAVVGGYKEFPNDKVMCLRDVRVSYVPTFTGDEVTDHTLFVGEDWSLGISPFVDFFGEKAEFKINLDTAA